MSSNFEKQFFSYYWSGLRLWLAYVSFARVSRSGLSFLYVSHKIHLENGFRYSNLGENPSLFLAIYKA